MLSWQKFHYDDVIMTMLASQITSLTVVYSIVYSGVNQRKHQSSASLAFVREIHRGPVNFPHKWPVTRKMFPFDDVIMLWQQNNWSTEDGEKNWNWNFHDSISNCHRFIMFTFEYVLLIRWMDFSSDAHVVSKRCPIVFQSSIKFQGHRGQKNRWFWPKLGVSVL